MALTLKTFIHRTCLRKAPDIEEASPSGSPVAQIQQRSQAIELLVHGVNDLVGNMSVRAFCHHDKGSIIIEIGRIYTKIGMSGEPAPRHIIRSRVQMKPYGALQDIWDSKYLHRDELYLIMCRFLQAIYLKYLMVNPKDYRVVIVEPLLCPAKFRNTLARAFFNHFSAPYVAFMPSPLLCLFSLGRQTCLVVDVGWQETTVLPIYEGIPVMSAWQSTSCAAQTVHNAVLQSILERGLVRNNESQEDKPVAALNLKELIEASLEDIIVCTCVVQAEDCQRTPPSAAFPLSQQYTLSINGSTRDICAEALFEEAADDQSLPVAVLDALIKCSSDCRRALSENILVVGGIASLPGFNYRLKQELEGLVGVKCQRFNSVLGALKFKFHQPPAHTSTTAWLGGSIFGYTEGAVLERAVSNEKFQEMNQCLPDWTSCDPDQHEQLRPVPTRKLLPASPASLYKSSKRQPAH